MRKRELKHYINVRLAGFGTKIKNGPKNARLGVKNIKVAI